MDNKRKSFILYNDYINHFNMLSMNERGELITAIFEYINGNELKSESCAVEMAFSFIKLQLDRDLEKYEKICKANRENGKKGGRPKNSDKPNGFLENPKETDETLNDNDNKKENNNVIVTDTDNDIDPRVLNARFEKFWTEYPKKEGRTSAERIFTALSPSEELVNNMLLVLKKQKKTKQWTKEYGRFIPLASNYLENRRWEDEVNLPDEDVYGKVFNKFD